MPLIYRPILDAHLLLVINFGGGLVGLKVCIMGGYSPQPPQGMGLRQQNVSLYCVVLCCHAFEVLF